MARQGLHQHRKFLRLARILGAVYIARGVLEMLWEPAYDSGDDFLGDGEDIAARCGWTGSSAELLTALLESEFIDEDEDRPGHYRIHDLLDHAPDAVAKRMEREANRIKRGTTLSELRAKAGRKGMKSRWKARTKQTDNKRITTDNKRITNLSTPSPSPTPSPLLNTLRDSAQSAPPPQVDWQSTLLDPRKKARKEKPPDPRHAPLKAKLESTYRQELSETWQFDGSDAKALSELIAVSPDEEIETRWLRGLRAEFFRVRRVRELKAKWGHHSMDVPGRTGTAHPFNPEALCSVCHDSSDCFRSGDRLVCYRCFGSGREATP